jgi:hypothetical protein
VILNNTFQQEKIEVIQENTSVVIIDFDNFFQGKDITNASLIEHEINIIISKILEISPLTEFCFIRLYGGWKENGIDTQTASKIQANINSENFFPLKNTYTKKLIRGKIELAVSLNRVPSLTWENTFRTRKGLPRIRSDKSSFGEVCNNSSHLCPAKLLDKFTAIFIIATI